MTAVFKNILPFQGLKKRMIKWLIPWLSVLREAFLAVDRSSLGRLERYFAFFSTI